jgi:glycosyltransferase involved in cell wall biosynthesis
MKILQVINFLAPVYGGSAEVPWQLSKALVKSGHDVTIYTSSYKFNPDALTAKEVAIHAFKSWLQFADFSITPSLTKNARREIKNFDIVHLHNFRTYQNMVVHGFAKVYSVPYVLQAHGSLTTYFQKGMFKKAFDVIWGRNILHNAARVIAVTDIEAEQYHSLGVNQNKIEIVPHGIDLAEFDNQATKGEFRKKYKINPDKNIVLYLGRIHKMKGLDILANAFADLSHNHKDIVLAIVGPDGGYLTILKKLVTKLGNIDNVIFTGPLYGQEKLEAYIDADIYVLPSSYEIFGITILEAWACGKPVVVTDRCGMADVVRDRAGLVVLYDKVQLRNALSKLLNDTSMRREFGKQGRKLVEEEYNWSSAASRVERIYNNVLANRKR